MEHLRFPQCQKAKGKPRGVDRTPQPSPLVCGVTWMDVLGPGTMGDLLPSCPQDSALGPDATDPFLKGGPGTSHSIPPSPRARPERGPSCGALRPPKDEGETAPRSARPGWVSLSRKAAPYLGHGFMIPSMFSTGQLSGLAGWAHADASQRGAGELWAPPPPGPGFPWTCTLGATSEVSGTPVNTSP